MKACMFIGHWWRYYTEWQRWPTPDEHLKEIYGDYFDAMPIRIRQCKFCGKEQQRMSNIYEWVRTLHEYKCDPPKDRPPSITVQL